MSFYQNLCCKSVVIYVIKNLNFPVGKEKAARISCENILAAFCLASQLQLISVLQSVYFLPSCALASITLLLVERIGYIERYIVNTALEVLIERHSIGLNQVLLTPKLEAIIPVDGKCPIAQALVKSHVKENISLGIVSGRISFANSYSIEISIDSPR